MPPVGILSNKKPMRRQYHAHNTTPCLWEQRDKLLTTRCGIKGIIELASWPGRSKKARRQWKQNSHYLLTSSQLTWSALSKWHTALSTFFSALSTCFASYLSWSNSKKSAVEKRADEGEQVNSTRPAHPLLRFCLRRNSSDKWVDVIPSCNVTWIACTVQGEFYEPAIVTHYPTCYLLLPSFLSGPGEHQVFQPHAITSVSKETAHLHCCNCFKSRIWLSRMQVKRRLQVQCIWEQCSQLNDFPLTPDIFPGILNRRPPIPISIDLPIFSGCLIKLAGSTISSSMSREAGGSRMEQEGRNRNLFDFPA